MSEKRVKIGIIGKMCSGKTTLSRHLQQYMKDKYHVKFETLSFAGKVYELAYDLFDMSREKKDRRLLQMIGTNMRMIDENVWVKYVMKQSREKDVLVEDCRYMNEFEALHGGDFLMIKIEIDEEYQRERLKRTYPDTYHQHFENLKHASEVDIEKIPNEKCHIVLNARDDELNFKKIEEFLDSYMEK